MSALPNYVALRGWHFLLETDDLLAAARTAGEDGSVWWLDPELSAEERAEAAAALEQARATGQWGLFYGPGRLLPSTY